MVTFSVLKIGHQNRTSDNRSGFIGGASSITTDLNRYDTSGNEIVILVNFFVKCQLAL